MCVRCKRRLIDNNFVHGRRWCSRCNDALTNYNRLIIVKELATDIYLRLLGGPRQLECLEKLDYFAANPIRPFNYRD